MEKAIAKAKVLIEALDYVQRFADKTVVIKVGGSVWPICSPTWSS